MNRPPLLVTILLLLCCGAMFHNKLSLADEPIGDEVTTIFVVRHADRQGSEDAISDDGRDRAQTLCEFLMKQRVAAVYSTNTHRTLQTAEPTAKAAGVPVVKYEPKADGRFQPFPSEQWYASVLEAHRGKAVLVVGHSNTVVPIVHGFGATVEYSIGEDEYHSIFIVAVGANSTCATRISYGVVPDNALPRNVEPTTSR